MLRVCLRLCADVLCCAVRHLPFLASAQFTFGWAFRGQRILAAVLASLVSTQGLGAKASYVAGSQRLLLSGCSAGARGAMMNLDYIDGILAAVGVPSGSVEVQGLLDSPLWVNVEPSTPHIMPLANETRAVFELVNATARLGPTCATSYPNYEDRWMCLFGQYRMPMLQTPYMLNAAQDDKFELPYNLGGTTPAGYNVQSWHPDQLAYAQAFGPAVLAVVNTLPTASQSRSAVFSTACFRHCVTDSAAFWNVGVAAAAPPPSASGRKARAARPSMPVSLRDAANEWYFGRAPTPYRVVQQCVGFRCGNCSTKAAKAVQARSRNDGNLPSLSPQSVAGVTLGVAAIMLCGVCTLVRVSAHTVANAEAPKKLAASSLGPRIPSAQDRYGRSKGRAPATFSETSRLLADL
jgi:hypothetical protein